MRGGLAWPRPSVGASNDHHVIAQRLRARPARGMASRREPARTNWTCAAADRLASWFPRSPLRTLREDARRPDGQSVKDAGRAARRRAPPQMSTRHRRSGPDPMTEGSSSTGAWTSEIANVVDSPAAAAEPSTLDGRQMFAHRVEVRDRHAARQQQRWRRHLVASDRSLAGAASIADAPPDRRTTSVRRAHAVAPRAAARPVPIRRCLIGNRMRAVRGDHDLDGFIRPPPCSMGSLSRQYAADDRARPSAARLCRPRRREGAVDGQGMSD